MPKKPALGLIDSQVHPVAGDCTLRQSQLNWIDSSLMPSEKYSCSESPLVLLKARTAMEGLSVIIGV